MWLTFWRLYFFHRFLRKIAYATKVAEQEDTEEEEEEEEEEYEVRPSRRFP